MGIVEISLARTMVASILQALDDNTGSEVPLSEAQALLAELIKIQTETPKIDSEADRHQWEQLTREDWPRALRELEASLSEEDAQRLQPFLDFWAALNSPSPPAFELPSEGLAEDDDVIVTAPAEAPPPSTSSTPSKRRQRPAKKPLPGTLDVQPADEGATHTSSAAQQPVIVSRVSLPVAQVKQPPRANPFWKSGESSAAKTMKQTTESVRVVGLGKRL
jgi:hypothetical protein